jgi:hypothetical protein
MRILIEGESYSLEILKTILGDRFYSQNGNIGTIDHVGYYHNFENEIVYLLPKLFIDKDNKILNKYDKDEVSRYSIDDIIKSSSEVNWLKKFLILFYKGLIEYRERYSNTLQYKENIFQLSTSLEEKEYSFLDIVLSFVNFHKKNKNIILLIHKKRISETHKKVNWSKTVKKSLPFITADNIPIYSELHINKKIIDTEEELLCIFYSVLNNFNDEYKFNIEIDKSYSIIKGKNFNRLKNNGVKILKKIRYKYFSDTLLKIYRLLEIYFSKSSLVSLNNKKEDFIMVKSYHLIFEDMIDKLLTSYIYTKETKNGYSLKSLKENKDGKIIDHLFEYNSLIDSDESIFFIGDSKYYKSQNKIEKKSIYKQFTYAKNVIQFNIDLLNNNDQINKNIRYRDSITEGYNITPNFFIQGILPISLEFDIDYLQIDSVKGFEYSYHFKGRIFDRDSLFLNYYTLNYLFILKSYSCMNNNDLLKYRLKIHKIFRNDFITYLKNNSTMTFLQVEFDSDCLLKEFVDKEFKRLVGRIYVSISNSKRLLLVLDNQDLELKKHFVEMKYISENYIDGVYFSTYELN